MPTVKEWLSETAVRAGAGHSPGAWQAARWVEKALAEFGDVTISADGKVKHHRKPPVAVPLEGQLEMFDNQPTGENT